MASQPPFLYDGEKYGKPFDPKAVTRASQQPKPRRPKQEGPLISFNQHPDSYLILPYGNTSATPMNPSVKKWIKWLRIVLLGLRSMELLCAIAILVFMIMIRGVEATTGWILRIVPGVAILHTVYGIYHLCRKSSGRTPASSASYMMFASFSDVSIIPFYAFGAVVTETRQEGWTTVLPDQGLMPLLCTSVFYLTMIGAALHFVTLGLSISLAVIFRKITQLPPDMNPLEDNLTSRHKRNKSSISTATTMSEKRTSAPLESNRSSGAPYEDLSRAPTIPFFHTRTQSTNSFSTYKDTPPPSRDARNDLPSRQYGIQPGNMAPSAMTDLKRKSFYSPSNPVSKHRGSYAELPLSDSQSTNIDYDTASHKSNPKSGNMKEAWYTADSFSASRSPKKTVLGHSYQPVSQPYDASDDFSTFSHTNPLAANPPSPHRKQFARQSQNINSPLSEISNNGRNSGDIADMSGIRREADSHLPRDTFKAKYYGDLKSATPPIMIGGKNNRQISSGNDYAKPGNTFRNMERREVSGKVAEEGRSGHLTSGGWGTRMRQLSKHDLQMI